ncbi:MAG: biopolymer transporter ExbD [Deltaproteobacteria bacterium]|nr:biopolymer transporter ExbD [Deltaproteobacteria bacterium]
MGGVSVESGKGGRKGVDQQINMVPFIDLLISLIAFLLMTAVWVQSGTLEAQQPAGAPTPESQPQPQQEDQLKIFVRPNEIAVGLSAADITPYANGPQQWDQLRTKLRERRQANRQMREVWVQPDSAVSYNTIIRVMDVVYEVWSEGQATPDFRELVTIRFL